MFGLVTEETPLFKSHLRDGPIQSLVQTLQRQWLVDSSRKLNLNSYITCQREISEGWVSVAARDVVPEEKCTIFTLTPIWGLNYAAAPFKCFCKTHNPWLHRFHSIQGWNKVFLHFQSLFDWSHPKFLKTVGVKPQSPIKRLWTNQPYNSTIQCPAGKKYSPTLIRLCFFLRKVNVLISLVVTKYLIHLPSTSSLAKPL